MKDQPTQRRRRRPAVVVTLAALVAALAATFAQPVARAETANPTLKVIYDAVGSTHIGAQVDTDMALGPTEIKVELDLVNGQFVDGSLAIPSRTVTFDVFGIPTRAKVTMTQVGGLTGALTPTGQVGKSTISATVAYDIRLSNVEARVFGIWWPLGIGSNCHTVDPVSITASTPAGEFFTINGGGRATGTYTIGSFTGCTPLNYFDIPGFLPWFGSIPINVLVPGSDNSVELNLSNPRYGGA